MLTLKNDTATIAFDGGAYTLTSADFGAIDATHSTAKGVEQIGERLVNTTLDTRPIEIIGFIRATTAVQMKERKAALYQMCDPRRAFYILPDAETSLSCNATETVKFAPSKLINNGHLARFVIDAFPTIHSLPTPWPDTARLRSGPLISFGLL